MTNMNYMEYTALMSAVDKIMEGRTVSICENPSWGADLKTFGVNWSACGTQNIEDAKKFAEKNQQGLQDCGKAECDADHCKL